MFLKYVFLSVVNVEHSRLCKHSSFIDDDWRLRSLGAVKIAEFQQTNWTRQLFSVHAKSIEKEEDYCVTLSQMFNSVLFCKLLSILCSECPLSHVLCVFPETLFNIQVDSPVYLRAPYIVYVEVVLLTLVPFTTRNYDRLLTTAIKRDEFVL